jgi:TolA-binding protein
MPSEADVNRALDYLESQIQKLDEIIVELRKLSDSQNETIATQKQELLLLRSIATSALRQEARR